MKALNVALLVVLFGLFLWEYTREDYRLWANVEITAQDYQDLARIAQRYPDLKPMIDKAYANGHVDNQEFHAIIEKVRKESGSLHAQELHSAKESLTEALKRKKP